jgi:hypothetical protein
MQIQFHALKLIHLTLLVSRPGTWIFFFHHRLLCYPTARIRSIISRVHHRSCDLNTCLPVSGFPLYSVQYSCKFVWGLDYCAFLMTAMYSSCLVHRHIKLRATPLIFSTRKGAGRKLVMPEKDLWLASVQCIHLPGNTSDLELASGWPT